ncbi:NAD-dependent epimerase/dehydratase family protein [Mucilaginibacter aquaedulcis]|uniref:NAD-dependent epimerase/dehydratase family protein n=1 Tax=Mucilaginibacter aquaedulcis TaxID=1187081 RepID=UPI0025B4D89C|nr:NAD-dependent epimerase/dehydratase family protein [Mucilaginibacter aquaedulcis]MDN3547450.1 NAD-dependent epimerase/dehydratase family protein [Mucilaginibacter aquaedulcis]
MSKTGTCVPVYFLPEFNVRHETILVVKGMGELSNKVNYSFSTKQAIIIILIFALIDRDFDILSFMEIKVIITGATGMVGEGVVLECLNHPQVKEVLIVTRKPVAIQHAKLKNLVVPDFLDLTKVTAELSGYDACLYCAGISSAGLNEAEYQHITYDVTMHFAQTLLSIDPAMVFCHISGSHADSSEKGKIMWARVKGKTENALMKLPFKKVYNFRPGFMKPTAGQKNVKSFYKIMGSLYPLFLFLFPNNVSTMREVGLAMINSVLKGYPNQLLEVKDVKKLAGA